MCLLLWLLSLLLVWTRTEVLSWLSWCDFLWGDMSKHLLFSRSKEIVPHISGLNKLAYWGYLQENGWFKGSFITSKLISTWVFTHKTTYLLFLAKCVDSSVRESPILSSSDSKWHWEDAEWVSSSLGSLIFLRCMSFLFLVSCTNCSLSRRECSSLEEMVPQQLPPTFLRVRWWSLWRRNYRETTGAPCLSKPQSTLRTLDHVMLSFSQFMNNLKGMTLIVVSLCLPQRRKCFQPVILLHLPLLPLRIYHCFITSALTDSRKATGLIAQNFVIIM